MAICAIHAEVISSYIAALLSRRCIDSYLLIIACHFDVVASSGHAPALT